MRWAIFENNAKTGSWRFLTTTQHGASAEEAVEYAKVRHREDASTWVAFPTEAGVKVRREAPPYSSEALA